MAKPKKKSPSRKKTRTGPQSKDRTGKITELINFWQERLQLRDWDIEVAETDITRQVGNDRLWGSCLRNRQYKTAKIWITQPEQHNGWKEWEHTLVHELLHIVLDTVTPEDDGLLMDTFECSLNHLASALVDLHGYNHD